MVSYSPAGVATILTRGWIDPANRHSDWADVTTRPGRFYDVDFDMQPRDSIVPAGHRLGLMVISSDRDFTIRPAPGTRVTLDVARSSQSRRCRLQRLVPRLRVRPRLPGRLHAPGARVVSGGPAREFVPGIAGGSLGGDFGSMYNSRSTDVTRPVWAIDLNLDPSAPVNTSTSGCQSSDYNGMPAGAIALVQRGTCTFAQKFKLANRSGAGGLILFNEGQPGRTVPLWFDVTGISVPSMAASYDAAEDLANGVENGATGLTARFRIDWRPGTYPTRNVIAETPSGDPDDVIVVGAHLDSVGVGPGINDNGSGSAALLEMAEQLSGVTLRNKIRFIWFSAEESGLLGSEAYVAGLPDSERDKIAAMLNFDMIGSTNFVRFVYDGDLSDSEPPEGGAPEGSADIEEMFLDYFEGQGLATEPTAFDGRSDYGPFIAAGIPAGGLFTGAEGIKTATEAAVYGGTAGQQYDSCYHLGCDDLDEPQQHGARADGRRRRSRDDHPRAEHGSARRRTGQGQRQRREPVAAAAAATHDAVTPWSGGRSASARRAAAVSSCGTRSRCVVRPLAPGLFPRQTQKPVVTLRKAL